MAFNFTFKCLLHWRISVSFSLCTLAFKRNQCEAHGKQNSLDTVTRSKADEAVGQDYGKFLLAACRISLDPPLRWFANEVNWSRFQAVIFKVYEFRTGAIAATILNGSKPHDTKWSAKRTETEFPEFATEETLIVFIEKLTENCRISVRRFSSSNCGDEIFNLKLELFFYDECLEWRGWHVVTTRVKQPVK